MEEKWKHALQSLCEVPEHISEVNLRLVFLYVYPSASPGKITHMGLSSVSASSNFNEIFSSIQNNIQYMIEWLIFDSVTVSLDKF